MITERKSELRPVFEEKRCPALFIAGVLSPPSGIIQAAKSGTIRFMEYSVKRYRAY
jgi:hypothetical protein